MVAVSLKKKNKKIFFFFFFCIFLFFFFFFFFQAEDGIRDQPRSRGLGDVYKRQGMVRAKNASEIVTKNLGLYSIACIMYLTCGFYLMYSSGDYLGGLLPQIGSHWSLAVPEDTVAAMQYGCLLYTSPSPRDRG